MDQSYANLLHELAAPLNSVYLSVQMIERQLFADNQPKSEQVIKSELQGVKSEIIRLAVLINAFRESSGAATTQLVLTDINTVIARWLNVIAAQAEARAIRIETELASDLPLIKLDSQKMMEVFLNLSNNAMEAMPGGGQLRIRSRRDVDKIMVEVSDTGMGIPEGIDIFKRFITTKTQGTGLGLPVVKKIMNQHCGTISYKSSSNGGTSFYLAFPIPWR